MRSRYIKKFQLFSESKSNIFSWLKVRSWSKFSVNGLTTLVTSFHLRVSTLFLRFIFENSQQIFFLESNCLYQGGEIDLLFLMTWSFWGIAIQVVERAACPALMSLNTVRSLYCPGERLNLITN